MQACVGRVEVLPGSGARLLEGIRNSIRLFGMSPSHHIIKKEMPIQLTDHMYIYIYIYIYLHIHMLYYILSCHIFIDYMHMWIVFRMRKGLEQAFACQLLLVRICKVM